MPEFNVAITISAFIAGVLTFFAPCTLPLVPAFLGIISGAQVQDLNDLSKTQEIRGRIFKNAVFYVLGFSIIFILFGVVFSFLGSIFLIRQVLEKLGSLFIIAFGLVLLGWLQIPWLSFDRQVRVPQLFYRVSLFNSFVLGALFALGWSPCVGPLLGSILFLASTSSTVLEGVFLLIVFSIGLGIPFLVTALLIGKAFGAFSGWSSFLSIINKIAGVLLIFIGFLLIFGKFTLVHTYFKLYFYNFQAFEIFINKFL
ncbi:MAG: hypothetical protein A3B86_03015 [Candidatus Yanofskybacteria bacterium RIFCSPHIGHO2_02_FULL_38_22b]|uniref:Cytochrome C biogenesis protein transmembrane domain-containing protein n=1 Tax=Candidatus Yanofskybacteria bacterium RIFCSPHIGHO2_02_FULL_38_22b TaxID=1802673 RepID=A0A1F8F144_9BACT|nr:MAG: hypothetical protein A2816_02610 [Candidatus Yanofskybacteria bacterium RIFCSPHIGHO2_01_FULL_39_44]OGN06843.1 MAG: hypothetical protein A3B86_03015 [Candidatus Yanofskybacteria bacterium RIFCSPHIGHO2_02_FULL_38_22b]OGN20738.1 MAG: hypothetical protein A2910_00975 [Candidatus Yanofskybacteria bacterium RIFCSPLOWO2_01_FULL_39_28]